MNQPRGISFGWYLSIWMVELHGDEQTFWRTMTPYRVMVLYKEHLRRMQPSRTAPPVKEAAQKEGAKPSLFAYITGKGG